MCEVCAAFGRGRHWTDRAGELTSRSEFVDIKAYRAERRNVVALLNRMLGPLGLSAEDWDGEAFSIRQPTGATWQAANLMEVWRLVERLKGASFDPLWMPHSSELS